MRLGVLDIGSNTVHLLVVDAHQGSAPLPAWKSKISLRLAEHLGVDGRIDEEAIADLVDFARHAQATAEDLGVTEFLAFATSAIREAPNGLDVIRRIREDAGLEVEVLSGPEEARLTFLAVRRWFGWSAGRILVLDIGGGSLELASGADEEPDVALSLPLGAGRLTREYLDGDPPKDKQIREARRVARAALGEVVGQILRAGEPRIAVATSKTFRQLARIAGAAPSSEGFHVRRTLSRADVHLWVPKLANMSSAERSRLPGVSEPRAPQLLAGAIVAEAAMDLLGVEQLEIGPWALREGVILRRIDGLDA